MNQNEPIYKSADPDTVEDLTMAICKAIEEECIPNETSAADILSALFTTTSRFMRSMRKGQTILEQSHNAKEVSRVLTDMLFEFGSVIH
jgi:hypothetical protein